MKKNSCLLIAIISMFGTLQLVKATDVVFNVTVATPTEQVWIVGNYNGWNLNLSQMMTKVDDTHYTITLSDATFSAGVTKSNLEYIYLCGPGDWIYREKDANGNELATNRKYTDNNGTDVVLKWGATYYTTVLPMNITINVTTPVGTIECYIVGNFNNWAGPIAPVDSCKMKKYITNPDGTILFKKTIFTSDAHKLTYNFCSGPDWSYEQKSPNGDFLYPEVNPVVTEWKAIYDPSKCGTIKINATVPTGTQKVWIQGNYLGWDMSKAVPGIKKSDGTFSFTVPNVQLIQYKLYNQPNWQHEEVDGSGASFNYRLAAYPTDSVTNITVLGWALEDGDYITPGAPTNLKITPGANNTLYLSWQAATDNIAVSNYEVYMDDILYGTTTNLGLNISGFLCKTKITVKAKDAAGNLSDSSIPLPGSLLKANAGSDKIIICGGTAQLNSDQIKYSGKGTLRYKWTPATGLNNDTIPNPTATVTSDIKYSVTVTTPYGCTESDTVKVSVIPLTVNAGTDKTIICGETVQLNNLTTNYTGNGTLTYLWSPSTGLNDSSIANPTATVIKNITYNVAVTTPNSCVATDNISVTIIPMSKPDIGLVGVSSSNKNIIVWNKPISMGIESYYIYRETNISNIYEKIGITPYDSLSVFEDKLSFPDEKSNKYKLSILDRSGLESAQSNSHKTVHLSINKGLSTIWNLIWEPYEGFTVTSYNIYRGTKANNMILINSTSGSSTQYSDMSAPEGDVFYQLEVISPNQINPSKVSASLLKLKDFGSTNSSLLAPYNSSRSNIATNVLSDITELGNDNKGINIYPNPVNNELRIDFEGNVTFEILNLMGKVVYNGDMIKSKIVQTSNLESGIYLIKFKVGSLFEYKKFIKE